ncbi:MAG: septum formation initiator family protein [Thermoleophilia bacterium]
MLTAILLGYIGPLNGYLAQRSQLGTQRAELARLQARHDQLTAQLKSMGQDDVLERNARRLGMHKPGERGYIFARGALVPSTTP